MLTLSELQNLPGAFMIGSRALNVESESSDYDIVIPYSSIPDYLQKRIDYGGTSLLRGTLT
jgi:predicted nucleotidyltransferase